MKYTAESLQAAITDGFLDLSCSDFSDQDMHLLWKLTGLQILSLWGTRIGDITALTGLTGLQDLDLSRTKITPEQIALLKASLPEIAIHH